MWRACWRVGRSPERCDVVRSGRQREGAKARAPTRGGLLLSCTDAPVSPESRRVRPSALVCEDGGTGCFCEIFGVGCPEFPEIPADSFAVVCRALTGPVAGDTVVRGEEVVCRGYFGSPRAFVVLERQARGTEVRVNRRDSVVVSASDSGHSWTGVVAAGARVEMRVRYTDSAGVARTALGRGRFVVRPRHVPEPEFAALRVERDSVNKGIRIFEYPYYRDVRTNRITGRFGVHVNSLTGMFGLESPDSVESGSGPNEGTTFFREWPQLGDSAITYISPALNPQTRFAEAQRWRAEQSGPSETSPTQCSLANVDTLRRETERHEGVSAQPATNSHYGIYQAFVREKQIPARVEAFVFRTSHAGFKRRYNEQLRSWRREVNRRHDKLDRDDDKGIFGTPPSSYGRLGCTPAYSRVP